MLAPQSASKRRAMRLAMTAALTAAAFLSACAARPIPYAPPAEVEEAPRSVPDGIVRLTVEQAEQSG